MSSEIRIPKLGMSATTMTLTEWMFGDGEEVEKGEIIYTVETDKSSLSPPRQSRPYQRIDRHQCRDQSPEERA